MSIPLRHYLTGPTSRVVICLAFAAALFGPCLLSAAEDHVVHALKQLELQQGIYVILGDCKDDLAIQLALHSQALIYVQSDNEECVAKLRAATAKTGLLGTRVYVELGVLESVHLADNLADGAIAVGIGDQLTARQRAELLRVVHPGAKVLIGSELVTKPSPAGADDWSHPYHGPDNNPQ